MKKGIILEQHRKYTILLTKDGSFEKGIVLNETAEIGEEVSYKPVKRSFLTVMKEQKHIPIRIVSLACIFLLCFISFYFLQMKQTYAYVTIDINPSIEMEINEEYRVQSIRPVNTDASLVTNELKDVKNETLQAVIQLILHKSEDMALVNEDKSILVGISFHNNEAENKQEVIQEMEEKIGLEEQEWNVALFHVPEDIRLVAEETNTSMNKILANQFVVNEDASEDLKTDYILDKEEIELISTFYEPLENENKQIQIMSEPLDTQNVENQVEEESLNEETGNQLDQNEIDLHELEQENDFIYEEEMFKSDEEY